MKFSYPAVVAMMFAASMLSVLIFQTRTASGQYEPPVSPSHLDHDLRTDINTASAPELALLPFEYRESENLRIAGVIVAERAANGDFTSLTNLIARTGITQRQASQVAGSIRLGGSSEQVVNVTIPPIVIPPSPISITVPEITVPPANVTVDVPPAEVTIDNVSINGALKIDSEPIEVWGYRAVAYHNSDHGDFFDSSLPSWVQSQVRLTISKGAITRLSPFHDAFSTEDAAVAQFRADEMQRGGVPHVYYTLQKTRQIGTGSQTETYTLHVVRGDVTSIHTNSGATYQSMVVAFLPYQELAETVYGRPFEPSFTTELFWAVPDGATIIRDTRPAPPEAGMSPPIEWGNGLLAKRAEQPWPNVWEVTP